MEAMGGIWNQERFDDYKLTLNRKQQCLSAWELIELVGMGHFSKGMNRQTLSMGISEVFQELILDVLRQVCLRYPLSLHFMHPKWDHIPCVVQYF